MAALPRLNDLQPSLVNSLNSLTDKVKGEMSSCIRISELCVILTEVDTFEVYHVIFVFRIWLFIGINVFLVRLLLVFYRTALLSIIVISNLLHFLSLNL